MKFLTRRQLLLMGLGAAIIARGSEEYKRDRQAKIQRQSFTEGITDDSQSIIDTAFNLEADWETEVAQRREILAATQLQNPLLDYNREISKWTIQSCKLAVQQYQTGRSNPKYNGDLTLLPDYNANFHNYTQLASFKIEEEILENYLRLPETTSSLNMNMMRRTLHDTESRIRAIAENIVRRRHRAPLFVGYVIASDRSNIIAFRGTQTQIEWLRNLQATQQEYIDRTTGKSLGKVHQGYLRIVRHKLGSSLLTAVRQLNPTIPCYITGHSLGGAIATLAALEIAIDIPQIREQLQLYTYGSPRIGDRNFAQAHSKLIPNSYRIVNLSDSVPLVPPIKIENYYTTANYAHVGQKWFFSTQFGDILLNHVVDTYRMAIESEQETKQQDPVDRMM